jgi:two-component system, LytTR family, response regulator
MTLKAILIDDEPLARSILKEYLQFHPEIKVVHECNDGFEGLKAIMQHQPDLIFLDIQMPKINGFEMLELIETPPKIIFTTAYEAFAIKAFEANAIDYLLKPFSRERFDRAIQKLTDQQANQQSTEKLLETVATSPAQSQRIVVKVNSKIKIIAIDQVHYIEAADDYVKICTAEESFLKNKTMSYFEEVLDPSMFVRIHRSYIVSINQVTRIDPYEKETHLALLRSGKKLPVSKTGYAKLRTLLDL